MRKKMALMLVLFLALGWAGSADAALVLSDSGGAITLNVGSSVDTALDPETLSLVTTTAIAGWDLEVKVISGSTLLSSAGMTFAVSFFLASGFVVDTPTSIRMSGGQLPPFSPPTAGPGTLFAGMGISGNFGTIELIDHFGGGVSLGQFDVVPEPMTVGLLALGGLGLLRRRRRVS